MPSFKSTSALVATAILALGAQAQITYEIDPNSVPMSTRENWCTSQKASCPLLCLQLSGSSSSTTANTCDPTTLDYQCTCGNGQAPDAAEYSQTIPYYECTEYGNQCVAACAPHDSACQTACRVNNPCGAQDPNSSSSTVSGMSATASGASPSGSSAASSQPTGTGSNSASPTQSAGSSSGSSSTGGSSSPSGSATDSGSKAGPTGSTKDNGAAAAQGYGFAIMLAAVSAGFALVM